MFKKTYLSTQTIGTRKILAALGFALLMTVAALLSCLPAVTANVTPTTNMETTAYLSFRPNPIGKGQQLLINAWVTPTPVTDLDLGLIPAGGFGSGIPRVNNNFYFTKPDGTVVKLENLTTYGDGSIWFTYTPDQAGTWTIQFNWTGVELWGAPGARIAHCSYLPCSTEKQTLVVQENPVPSYPATELPTGYWDWPVNPDNREWADIIGAWYNQRYDATQSSYQPYSQGPESSHILWMQSTSELAGLIGQPYGYTSTYSISGSYATVDTVMYGRAYYGTGNDMFFKFSGVASGPQNIHCIDLRTGEELWAVPGTFSAGAITSTGPVLLEVNGNNILKYNALTGALLLNSTSIPGAMSGFMGSGYINYPYAVVKQHIGTSLTTGYYLVKINLEGPATDISQRVVWNVTIDSFHHTQPSADFKLAIYDDIVYHIMYPVYADTGAINFTTGEILWHHAQDTPYGIEMGAGGASTGYGNAYFGVENRHFIAYDLKTGNVAWVSEQTNYPWGNFWAYESAVAYNKVYGFGYDGIYAFNVTNGKIVWHYKISDPYGETPYSQYPIHGMSHIIGDGKVYAATCEHSPTFYYRGYGLYCLDAYNGNPLWTISGYYTPSALAEGTLFATNAYDGNAYAFTKGETVTTVAVQNDVYAKGSTVLIKGSVMDLSPAQPNTPAVSDDSMTGWMEYLHMQQPKPTNTTGVQVKLTAVSADGTTVNIGKATSTADGNYAFAWTPSAEGVYYIKATFEGSKSYYASSDETSVCVGSVSTGQSAAPSPTTSASPTASASAPSTSPTPSSSGSPSASESPTQAPPPTESPSVETYIIAAVVAVIIVVVVAAVILRKRK